MVRHVASSELAYYLGEGICPLLKCVMVGKKLTLPSCPRLSIQDGLLSKLCRFLPSEIPPRQAQLGGTVKGKISQISYI